MVIHVGSNLSAEGIRARLAEDLKSSSGSELLAIATAIMAAKQDHRTTADAVQIDEVDTDPKYPSVVTLLLTVSWSKYIGCRDMDEADDEQVSVAATYSGGQLICRVPLPRRPRNDC